MIQPRKLSEREPLMFILLLVLLAALLGRRATAQELSRGAAYAALRVHSTQIYGDVLSANVGG